MPQLYVSDIIMELVDMGVDYNTAYHDVHKTITDATNQDCCQYEHTHAYYQ